jgi:uncharacterized protein YdaU (DUF1376 family)
MKWYYHEPDAALNGMAELNLEQRGAYYSILDLLYARDGIVPDDDLVVARMIRVHWRSWRALKKQLMAAGKIRVTTDGLLTANRVSDTLKNASRLSQDQRRRVSKRWQEYKNANEIKNSAPTIRGNTSKTIINNSEISTSVEKAKPLVVNDVENVADATIVSTAKSTGTDELKALIKRKWLIGP